MGSGLAILNGHNPFQPLSLGVHLSNRGLMGLGSTLKTSLNIEKTQEKSRPCVCGLQICVLELMWFVCFWVISRTPETGWRWCSLGSGVPTAGISSCLE